MCRFFSLALLLFSFSSIFAQGGTVADSSSVKKSYIHLLHADVTRFDKNINPDAWILVGDVSFRRDSMYMACDSAHYYQEKNSFQAFGNVKMEQGDTLFLYGDYADYDGDANIARVRRGVQLINRNVVLETDSLDFDRNTNLGYFFEYGVLSDEESTLASYYGEYNVNSKDALFLDDVSLENPKFRLTSDTLRYNTDSKIAGIVGPTNIYSGDNEVYSERGFYNTASRQATLLDRSVIYNGSKNVSADSIYYDMQSGYSESFGDILYNDDNGKNMMTGDYAYLNELVDSAYVTGRAMVCDYSQKDSLFMHADTISIVSYNLASDSLYRKIKAFNKVRAWETSMQAVCDSLVFDSRDSCMTLYKDPILWNNNVQLLGEVVKVYMDSTSIDWVHVINQTLYAEPVDSLNFNQIKGKEMRFLFSEGKLAQMQVDGNVEIIFFPLDEDSTFIGMNTTIAGKAVAYLKEGQVDKVVVPTEASGIFYPMGQRPPDKCFLENFSWFDYVRPLSKEDIFIWRGKEQDKKLKVFKRDAIPLPTLEKTKKEVQ